MAQDNFAVIFDMDGVLVDSYDAHFRTWREVLAAELSVDLTEAQFAATFGMTSRESIPKLCPQASLSDSRIAEIDAKKEARFREMIRDTVPIMDGARELLASLRESRVPIAVASSAPPENVLLCIERIGRHFFDSVVTGADVKRGKPDPEPFLCSAQKLQVTAPRCIVIEDAPAGIAAARAAGMACIGLMSTGRSAQDLAKADRVIRSLRELSPPNILALLGG